MGEKTINLKGLNMADVLAVLYNSSKPQAMGFMHYNPKPMIREEAQKLLDTGQTYFDYLDGRVMKIDLSKDELNPWGYDRDNGQGAAENAISSLRSTSEINSKTVRNIHKSNTQDAARNTKSKLHEKSHLEGNVLNLGLDDVSDVLNERIDKGLKKLRDSEKSK